MKLDSRIPDGPVEEKWDRHRFDLKLINPANKRKYSIIMVGTGLAGGSAAASLAELGYHVKSFCFQDLPAPTPSPRRAGSMRPRTTRTTAIRSGGSSTTRSKEATTGPGKETSTGWPSSA